MSNKRLNNIKAIKLVYGIPSLKPMPEIGEQVFRKPSQFIFLNLELYPITDNFYLINKIWN